MNWKERRMRAKEDVEAVLLRDPAASSRWIVRLCYPGLTALRRHRRAHAMLGERASRARPPHQPANTRKKTSIEIHPGATIGAQGVHRPRRRRGHRRNGRRRRRRDHLPGRYAGRHGQGRRQAAPDHRQRRHHRRGREGAGPDHHRRSLEDRRRRHRPEERAAVLHGRRQSRPDREKGSTRRRTSIWIRSTCPIRCRTACKCCTNGLCFWRSAWCGMPSRLGCEDEDVERIGKCSRKFEQRVCQNSRGKRRESHEDL